MSAYKFFRQRHVMSSEEIRIAQDVTDWTTRFLVPPHPMMRRPPSAPEEGLSICPFVKRSLQRSLFYFDFNYDVTGESVDQIVNGILPYIQYFPTHPVNEDKKAKDDVSLVVLFPRYRPQKYKLLDDAHGRLKNSFVDNGLMLAEFYPGSVIGSKHNEDLHVYNAPHAFMAVRYMAPHDILFIGKNRQWFSVYHRTFREFWSEPHSSSYDHLKALYDATLAEFDPNVAP